MKNSGKLFCIRIFSALLLLLGVIFAAVSCSENDENDSYEELYDAMSQYYDENKNTSDSASDPSSLYSPTLTVIIPAGCNAEMYDGASILAEQLSKRTGGEVKLKYDSDYKASSKEIEILIGKTDRSESLDFLKRLRSDDYGYKADGQKIVIAGQRTDEILDALKIFSDAVSSGKIKPSNIASVKEKVVRGEYNVERIKLNGFEISEYVIAYPKENSLGEREKAEKLAADIETYGGYVLPVVSDKECKGSASVRVICIGQTELTPQISVDKNKSEASIVSAAGGHIALAAHEKYGLTLACDKFIGLIRESEKDKVCEVAVDGSAKITYSAQQIGVFFVTKAFGEGDLDIYRNTVNAVNAASPSVVILNRPSADVLYNLQNNLGSFICVDDTLYYRITDTDLRCISSNMVSYDSGSIAVMTFEFISTKARCAFVCNLPDASSGSSSSGTTGYKSFADVCGDLSEMPLIAFCDMGSENAEKFLKEHPHMERLSDVKETENCFFASCGSRLFLMGHTQTAVNSQITADSAKFILYS